MTKETKAVREARLVAEQEAKMQKVYVEVSSTWAKRLADVTVAYANLPGFSIGVSDTASEFKLSPPEDLVGYNHHYEVPVVLEYAKLYDGMRAMEDAEYAVRRYHEEQAAAERQRQVVQGAIAKLNKEEQDLLKSYWSN